MKILILILAIFLPLGTFAATVSGETTIKVIKKTVTTSVKAPIKAKSSTGTTVSVPRKITTKYIAGPK